MKKARQQESPKLSEGHTSGGSQRTIRARVLSSLSLILSPIVMHFIYSEEEKVEF